MRAAKVSIIVLLVAVALLGLGIAVSWAPDRPVAELAARRDIAGSRAIRFEDLGHVPHEEDAARTVVAVQSFLGD